MITAGHVAGVPPLPGVSPSVDRYHPVGADPPGRPGRRRGHPDHLQRRGDRVDRSPSTWCPGPGRAGGLDLGPRSAPGDRGTEPGRYVGRRWPGRTARSCSGSARCRRSATARPTRPRSRTRSTSTRAQRGQGVGRALLAELVVLAAGPRLPLGDRPDRAGTTRPPSACTRRAASSWSAWSGRWAASSAAGSTSWCSSGCSRARAGPLLSRLGPGPGLGPTRAQARPGGRHSRLRDGRSRTRGRRWRCPPGVCRHGTEPLPVEAHDVVQLARGTVSTAQIHSRVEDHGSGVAVDELLSSWVPPGRPMKAMTIDRPMIRRPQPADGHRGQEDEPPGEVPGLDDRAEERRRPAA